MNYKHIQSTLQIIAIFMLAVTNSFAQLSISPPYVSIDEKSGVGNMYVVNNSEKSQEIEISFVFGYPGSDAEGNLVMNYSDSTAFAQYALDNKVSAFPKSFILQPKQQRTVRVQIKSPSQIADGFYFTRAKILARPQTPDVSKEVQEGITTRLTFNFEQVIPAFYHRGKVSTGLIIRNIETSRHDSILAVKTTLDRTGNAPFIGTMYARLLNAKGKIVAESQSSTTAYFTVIRRLDVNVSKVTPGDYKLEVSFETKRGDMSIDDLVQAKIDKQTIDVTIK